MEIIYKTGNLLDAQTDVVAHQVNCQGVMGSGVAKQIKEKWPEVFESYKRTCDDSKVYPYTIHDLMGRCDSGPDPNEQKPYIANLHAQLNYGRDGKRYTNYEALYQSLEHLRQIMLGYKYSSVAFPYKMSSDRGGADWNVVLAMIESVFKDTDVTIEIWSLNGYAGCN